MSRLMALILIGIPIGGCAVSSRQVTAPEQPESDVLDLCRAGKFHAAMRALPLSQQAWAEYTTRTGNTVEGAAGFEYANAMFEIAARGDADWGKILDDPDIPYVYKTEMVFEILEARLGKGGVYVANEDNLIVPRRKRIDLETERIALPQR